VRYYLSEIIFQICLHKNFELRFF